MKSLNRDGPSLRQMEEALASRIVEPLPTSRVRARAELLGWLYVPSSAPADERVNVYAHGYPARVHDALAETYPALARVVGAAAFQALAQRYAASVPLGSYNLNDAGAQMGAFLGRDALGSELPFLSDLAALEWRVAQAFHAAERPALDPSARSWTLGDWANALLCFQPSVSVMSSIWPLLELWAGDGTRGGIWPTEAAGEPGNIVVRRVGFVVRCEAVSGGEALALRLLLDGRALGDSMGRLDEEGYDPAAVSEWFTRWTAAGMIADARLIAPEA